MTNGFNSVQLELDGSLTALSRQILGQKIAADINAYCVELYADEPRRHLGASVIGEECSRKVWYLFRWFSFERFSGRMMRLFNRGHREEDRWIQWLRGIGITVYDVDPQSGDQWRIKAVKGHFGGSLDGIAQTPWPELSQMPFLLEFKTHNAKSYAKLQKDGVRKSKPRHYKQICTYGRAYGYTYAIYLAINKDNDDIYVEVVEIDWSLGDDMYRRADEIINLQVPPARIAQNPTFEACKFCAMRTHCWNNVPPEKNCRSCRNAYPVDGGEWYCGYYSANIPAHVISTGCDSWQSIA